MHSDRKKQILRYAQNDTEFGWRERDEVEIEERSLPPASRQVVGAREGVRASVPPFAETAKSGASGKANTKATANGPAEAGRYRRKS